MCALQYTFIFSPCVFGVMLKLLHVRVDGVIVYNMVNGLCIKTNIQEPVRVDGKVMYQH